MQLSLNLRRRNADRWLIYCSPAGDTEPEIGQDRTFATLDALALALEGAGVAHSRYGPTIRAAKDGYESGFLISPAEAGKLEVLDEDEIARRFPGTAQYRRVR